MPAPRGNFDSVIASTIDRHAYDNPTTYEKLKLAEKEMEPRRKRPKVRMEADKTERDYPYTRTYNYVEHDDPGNIPGGPPKRKRREPDAQERKMPRSELNHSMQGGSNIRQAGAADVYKYGNGMQPRAGMVTDQQAIASNADMLQAAMLKKALVELRKGK